MLQVVETNLVAFDCHWILINEVSVMEMIYGSCTGCAFSSPYCPGNMDGFRSRTLLGVWRREESIKSFWLLLFHIISSNNTQNLMTKDILFHFSEHLLLCTTNKNNPLQILYVLYSPVIKDGATIYKQRFQRWQRWPWKNSFGWAYIPWQVQNRYQHLSINGFLD